MSVLQEDVFQIQNPDDIANNISSIILVNSTKLFARNITVDSKKTRSKFRDDCDPLPPLSSSMSWKKLGQCFKDPQIQGSLVFTTFTILILVLLFLLVGMALYQWLTLSKYVRDKYSRRLKEQESRALCILEFEALPPEKQDAYLDWCCAELEKALEEDKRSVVEVQTHCVPGGCKERVFEEVNWLNKMTSWLFPRAYFPSYREKKHFCDEDMYQV